MCNYKKTNLQKPFLRIHVNPVRVGPTVVVRSITNKPYARVCLVIKELLQHVVQNVSVVLTALLTKPAVTKNVSILVKAPVVLKLYAK